MNRFLTSPVITNSAKIIHMPVENDRKFEIPSGMALLHSRKPSEIDQEIPFIVMPSTGLQQGISRGVVISNEVLEKLKQAQSILDKDSVILVLKRGYFPRTNAVILKEKLGVAIYSFLYGSNDVEDIFDNSKYGHQAGMGVDLGVYDKLKDKYILSFLPTLNVFSPKWLSDRYFSDPYINSMYGKLVSAVTNAGFQIHPQLLEARQMHCYIL